MKKRFYVLFFCTLIIFAAKTANADLHISEIMANPKGKDENKEWIEIYNDSPRTTSLEGWKIANDKDFFELNGNIPGKTHILIKAPFTLKNSDGTILLISPSGSIIEKINYLSKEGLSYSHILIKNIDQVRSSWLLTAPSPATKNPSLEELQGIISIAPQVKDHYFFEINHNQSIYFKLEGFDYKEISEILQIGSYFVLLVQKEKSKNILQEYRIKSFKEKITKKEADSKASLFLIIVAISLSAIYYLKKVL